MHARIKKAYEIWKARDHRLARYEIYVFSLLLICLYLIIRTDLEVQGLLHDLLSIPWIDNSIIVFLIVSFVMLLPVGDIYGDDPIIPHLKREAWRLIFVPAAILGIELLGFSLEAITGYQL